MPRPPFALIPCLLFALFSSWTMQGPSTPSIRLDITSAGVMVSPELRLRYCCHNTGFPVSVRVTELTEPVLEVTFECGLSQALIGCSDQVRRPGSGNPFELSPGNHWFLNSCTMQQMTTTAQFNGMFERTWDGTKVIGRLPLRLLGTGGRYYLQAVNAQLQTSQLVEIDFTRV